MCSIHTGEETKEGTENWKSEIKKVEIKPERPETKKI
jgi:hypothetical protein